MIKQKIKNAIIPDLSAADLKDTHPQSSPPHHNKQDEDYLGAVGDVAHHVSEGLGIVGKSLHLMRKHLPGLLHQGEQFTEVFTEVAHNHTTGDPVEDKVCGLAAGVTKIVLGGAAVASVSLPGLNEVVIPLLAEEVSAVVIALSTGASLHQAVDTVVKPCADVVKKSCHTAFANNRKFRANHPVPEIDGIHDALFALNPTDPRNSGKKPKRVSIHPKPINFRELFTKVVDQLKEIAPIVVDPNSDMTKMLRALEPSNPVNDERFKYDRKKQGWPKIKSKYERETQDNHADIVTEDHQPLTRFSCTKDRSKHHFVTPNYVSKERMKKENGEFLYVISEKEKLTIAKQTSLSMDESGHYLPASHMDLARGKPVLGAGMIRVQDGKIVHIDNHAPDYKPVDVQGARLKNTTEQTFLTHGFADAQGTFTYTSLYTVKPAQKSSSDNVAVSAIIEENEKLLSSQSLFSSRRTYTEEMSSLGIPSILVSQPSHSVSSRLAPVDFAAHKANFSQLISKQNRMAAPRVSATQQQFFGETSSSVVSTFNVSRSNKGSISIISTETGNDHCSVVKGPTLQIKTGDGPWSCPMSLK